ncbi:MAG TPA: sialidase family protein [Gemmataceae bacterium]|nr:sialidase family protein [Gemmataceae bacterium]
MPRLRFALAFVFLWTFAVAVPAAIHAQAPQLVSVTKIWDKAPHSAFTDLIRWRGKWYCVFREAEGHVGGDGKLRILESTDGKSWQSVALVAEEGIDLRDPHLSITPDDRLMIVAGGSVYRGTKTIMGRQPRVAFSKDARTWTPTQRVLSEGDWLWRVTWHEGRAYGVSYGTTGKEGWVKLFGSTDGVKYDLIAALDIPGRPNETTLRFLPDGEMLALVRREGGNTFGWIGSSRAPYREWKWHETKHRLGGPNFIRLPDGSLWASSRSYPGGAKTVVARMKRDGYEPALTLPSGGDTSYAGLVWHDGLLWVSYYSSHEGKSSIYLATVRLPQGP